MSIPKRKPTQQEKKPPQSASQQRFPADLKDRAVRMVHQFCWEDPGDQGVISRVSRPLSVGTESLPTRVKQADIDAVSRPGVTTDEQAQLAELERGRSRSYGRQTRWRAAATFFGAELDRRRTR